MRPLIVPTSSFYNFTTTVIREPMPFSDRMRFAEFCDLVENLVLSEQIYAWNLGAYPFEWEGGYFADPANTPSAHPYKPFDILDNVTVAPLERLYRPNVTLVEAVSDEDQERYFQEHFGDQKHSFTLKVALSMYGQAYNGVFGDVTVREPAMLRDVLPYLLSYTDGKGPIAHDPLIIKALTRLNTAFSDMQSQFAFLNTTQINIPPLAAVLLYRLPDNCSDPYLILREVYDLRNELTSARQRFSELEISIYSDSVSLRDMREAQREAQKAIEIDAGAFTSYVESKDSVEYRWFTDKLVATCKALILQGISLDSIVNLLADIVPSIERRLRVRSPSRLLRLAKDSYNMPAYRSLALCKLGLHL